MQGRAPENEETVALFHLLSQANVDLRQPVSLEQQLMEDTDLDADVGLAMVSLLKVSPNPQEGGVDQPCVHLLSTLSSFDAIRGQTVPWGDDVESLLRWQPTATRLGYSDSLQTA